MLYWHPTDGIPGAAEVAPGKRHDIPGELDCRACHGSTRPGPLGFNALQLSTDRDPNAIHGEPLAPGMITLATLEARAPALAGAPRDRSPNRRGSRPAIRGRARSSATSRRTAGPATTRSGETTYRRPVAEAQRSGADGDAVAARAARSGHDLAGARAARRHEPHAERRARPTRAPCSYRMRSRRPSSQMPPLGTVLRDEKAIAAIEKWMATDLVKK